MYRAIEEAKKTLSFDVPVGCVIVRHGEVIAAANNRKEETNDVTAHAEVLAIKAAQKVLKCWRLDDCELYVTLEPCPMCAWAILQSRIKTVYFGSYNTKCGAFGTVIDLKRTAESGIKIYGGIEEEKCDKILDNFFERLRK